MSEVIPNQSTNNIIDESSVGGDVTRGIELRKSVLLTDSVTTPLHSESIGQPSELMLS
jgi:hypothetical protein